MGESEPPMSQKELYEFDTGNKLNLPNCLTSTALSLALVTQKSSIFTIFIEDFELVLA